MGACTLERGAGAAAAWTDELNRTARDVAGALVEERLRPLLAATPEVDADDVVQLCVQRIWRAYGRFDPGRGSFSTFCGAITRKQIADVVRKNVRRARLAPRVDPKPGFAFDAPREDWPERLRNVHNLIAERLARYAAAAAPPAPGRRPAGRPSTYTPAQYLAVAWLRRERGLSKRGLLVLLATSPDLLAALGLHRVPGGTFVQRAAECGPKFKKILTLSFGRAAR